MATLTSHAVLATACAFLLASCVSSEQAMDLGMPAYTGDQAQTAAAEGLADPAAASALPAPATATDAEGAALLPEQVAYLPMVRPGTEDANPPVEILAPPAGSEQTGAAAAQGDAVPAGTPITAEAAAALDAAAKEAEQQAAASAKVPLPSAKPQPPTVAEGDAAPSQDELASAGSDELDPPAPGQAIATSAEWPVAEEPAPKKKGFLNAFFGASSSGGASAAPLSGRNDRSTSPMIRQTAQRPVIATTGTIKPVIENAAPAKPLVMASLGEEADSGNSLPGVRQTALFEIKRKSGLDDDSDVDLHEDEESPVRLALAPGMARLAPNGLLKQTDSVDVACLKPSLVRVLKTIEQHYGRKIVVTSGYRDRSRNRRARGAKNSLHMYCAAADVQVAGVGKWELANFVRSMPGRGGVGTYCHTESVHIDVGPERDWNWRCRRRK